MGVDTAFGFVVAASWLVEAGVIAFKRSYTPTRFSMILSHILAAVFTFLAVTQ